jgi:hypothetical protein
MNGARARAVLVRAAQSARAHGDYAAGRVNVPPPQAKRRQLLRLFRERGHSVFVESGTYRGDTVAFFLAHAERIVSVEVEPSLQAAAARRFADHGAVEILLGDALDLIPPLLAREAAGTLLFLDGHWSGGVTGTGREHEPAASILVALARREQRSPLTIVVDDLRLFGTDPEFPTLDALTASARSAFPEARIHAGLDALIIEA